MTDGTSKQVRGPTRKKRSPLNTLALGLVAAAVLGTVAFAATDRSAEQGDADPVPASKAGPVAACVVQADPDAELWVPEDEFNQVMDSLDAKLGDKYGELAAPGDKSALARGVIGLAVDYAAREIVVVADTTRIDPKELESDVDGSVPSGIGLRVQNGCHSAAELFDAQKLIEARSWHPDMKDLSYDYTLDPGTSTFSMTIPSHDAAGAIKEKLGDLVVVTEGKPTIG